LSTDISEAPPEQNVYGLITEEALEKLRSRCYIEYPIEKPFLRYVNRDSIAHAARAVGDANPLFFDREHAKASRYGKLAAPPALLYGVHWGSWDLRRGDGLPGVHGLHSRDHWLYYRPILEGDEIRATKTFTTLEEKKGNYAGRSIIQDRELKFFNQRDELVARCHMAAFRVERHAGKETAKYGSIEKARYTPEQIREIDAAIEAEIVRGGQARYWEDVQIGEKCQPIVRGPLTIADMIAWLMGIGSPHVRSGQHWLAYRKEVPKIAVPDPETNIPQAVERVHWDPFMAAEIGMPGPYDYGSQRGGWATHFATNWAGDDGWVAQVNVQYRGMNFLGDTVYVGGEVLKKWISKTSGIGFVLLRIDGTNQRGSNIMPGTALIALPQKGKPLPLEILDHDDEQPE
jgi:acyl dehydratase